MHLRLSEKHRRVRILTIRCAEITLRHRAPLAVQPLAADMCAPPLIKGSTATQIQPGLIHPASTLMSHWHSVTRLQQAPNGKLGASSPLLRFYKASRSPAATSTQRITQPRNNKRAWEGMCVTSGPASHTAKTEREKKNKSSDIHVQVYDGSSFVRCSHCCIS